MEPHPDGPLASTAVLTRFRTRKTAALFACLALRAHHSERGYLRDELLETLWGESPVDAARVNLRVALNALRNELEPQGVPSGAVLGSDRQHAWLVTEHLVTDLARFDRLLTAARGAPDAEATLLDEAVSLYRGPLAPEHDESYLNSERLRCEASYVRAARRVIHLHSTVGNHAAALQVAEQARAVAPHQEELHQEWIRLLLAAGDVGAALRACEELENLLDEELGAPPSPETRRLFREVQRAVATDTVEATRPPADRAAFTQTGGAEGDRSAHRLSPPSPTPPFLPHTRTLLLVCPDATEENEDWTARIGLEITGLGGRQISAKGEWVFEFAAATAAADAALRLRSWGAPSVPVTLHTDEAPARLSPVPTEAELPNPLRRLSQAGHPGQVLCCAVTAGLLGRSRSQLFGVTDLGFVRLQTEGSPERVFQVESAGQAPVSYPPLRAAGGLPSRLPLRPGRIYGRSAEVERLLALLTTPSETRVVTLTGPGGVGKTRLALEVAHLLEGLHPGAVWLVPLAELSEPDRMPQTFRNSVGLSSGGDPVGALAQQVGERPAVVVLDNAEHLLDVTARLVVDLVAQAPQLRCLVTSRIPLLLAAEEVVRLAPLPTPNVDALVEVVASNPCVQLFVERARASRPDFRITPGNVSGVAEICQQLEGLPLALELAAPRLGIQSVRDLHDTLTASLDQLRSRRRDLPQRHRTLRATLDWSFQFLAPKLQRMLARLTLFRGGWTAEAAAYVVGDLAGGGPLADMTEELEELREASLLVADPGTEPPRFRLLEMVREYAHGCLEESEAAAVEARHREYFFRLAAGVPEAVRAGRHRWLDGVEVEQENLRAALESSFRADPVAGLECCVSLGGLWEARGYWEEGGRLTGIALAQAPEAPLGLRGQALSSRAWLAVNAHEVGVAVPVCEEAVAVCRAAGEWSALGRALTAQGVLATRRDRSRARQYFEEAREVYEQVGNLGALMSNSWLSGDLAYWSEDYVEAERCYRRSLEEATGAVAPEERRFPLVGLGRIELERECWDTARALLDEALDLCRRAGDRGAVAGVLGDLCVVCLRQGDFAQAWAALRESFLLTVATGGVAGARNSIFTILELLWAEGDLGAAAHWLAVYESFTTLVGTTTSSLVVRRETRLREALPAHSLQEARRRVAGRDPRELVQEAIRYLQERGQSSALAAC